MPLLKIVVAVACWGMPPNYSRRFDTAYNEYRRTLQPASWTSFLDLVRKERAAANVVVSSRVPYVTPSTTHQPIWMFNLTVRVAASVWILFFSADYNTIQSLILRSSVAFLAVPGLVDFAQFFIIVSIGLSLGCVVMGFNGEVGEKLSGLQHIPPPSSSYVTQPYVII
jgi:hypothetical protein